VLRGLFIKEAISSVAIEHAASCQCDVCKAADGDIDALARVWVAIDDAERKREGEG
jgi:hypothetical protein